MAGVPVSWRWLVFAAALSGLWSSHVVACGSVLLRKESSAPTTQSGIHAYSFDWEDGEGFFVYQPAGQMEAALSPYSRDATGPQQGFRWKSLFPILSINQIAPGFPYGAINPRGVSAVVLNNFIGKRSAPASRSTRGNSINELQWISFIVSTSENLDEAIFQAKRVNIERLFAYDESSYHHYFVCDGRECAVFDYSSGELVVTEGAELEIPVLTNTPYAGALAYAKAQLEATQELSPPPPGGFSSYMASSFPRFLVLAERLRKGIEPTPQAAFELLDAVRIQNLSKWQVLFDAADRALHFRLADRGFDRILSLEQLDRNFSDIRWTQGLDGGFVAFDPSDFKTLMENAARNRLRYLRPAIVEALIRYSHRYR